MNNEDKPATPCAIAMLDSIKDRDFYHAPGLTKREYFAARAMQSMIILNNGNHPSNGATQALHWADATLIALESSVIWHCKCGHEAPKISKYCGECGLKYDE